MSWLLRRRSGSPEDRFAYEMVALARSVGGIKAERLDGFRLRLEAPGHSPVVMNLHNIFLEAQQLTGDAREARLRTAVLAMTSPARPQRWEEAAPTLMPAVRAVSWLTAGGTTMPTSRPFLPFLRQLCAIDAEHALTYVTDEDLAKWGVDADLVFATASSNLDKRSVEVGRVGPIAIFMGPDSYTSSWLATPIKLRRIAADVGRNVIAVAATRDSLVLVDANDARATLKVMEEELKSYQEAPRQLSPVPYRIADSGLELWDPPNDHPARPLVQRAQHTLASVEYQQQESVLNDRLGKAGEDVHVATYSLAQRADGSLWSWAVWVKQVTNALLPQVDIVVMGDNDRKEDRFEVRWSDAVRIAGDWLVPDAAFDPPRWRYRSWPPDVTLEALRSVAVQLPPPAD